jgi:CelD/BcsL family acetyltransferase involved in cellulose biosynthesis
MLAALPRVIAARHTVELVSDVEAFEALRREWDELLTASNSRCVFLSWEWLFTWWKHLREDRLLSILAVRRGSELVAIAPLALRPRRFTRACPLPVLEFLGSGFVGSDYLDVIVRNGAETEACQALILHLAKGRVPLKLTNLKRGQNVAARVLAGLSEQGWTTAEARTNTCPFISLAGTTWASYLASLSAEHRYNFNRKLRSLNRNYEVRFEQVRSEGQCCEALDLLIGQHNTRWRARGGSDAFHTAELVAFHREWTRVALECGWLRFYVLRLNDKPAACLYGMQLGETFYFYQSSFDAAFTQSSVGLIAMGLAIQSAIGEGDGEFDLLHGSEGYKSHWSRESRDLGRLESFPPGGVSSVYRLSVELGRASRAFARRMTKRGQAK